MHTDESLLVTLNSCLLALGPQVSFRAIDEELVSCKDLLTFLSRCKEDFLTSVLEDYVRSFHALHGTGTSTLVAYIAILSSHVIRLEMPQEAIIAAFSLLESIFCQTCEAIELKGVFDDDDDDESDRLAKNNTNDVDWFFDKTEGDEAQLNAKLSKINSRQRRLSDYSIALGLQHSLSYDFIQGGRDCIGLSEPMSLMMESIGCTGLECTLLRAKSSAQLYVRAVAGAGCLEITKAAPGEKTYVYSGPGVLFYFKDDDWRRIRSSKERQKQSNENNYLFANILVISGYVDAGGLSGGYGSSQQANLATVKYSVVNALDTVDYDDRYYRGIILNLVALNIDLLLAENFAVSERFIELCMQVGVIVLGLPSCLLPAISALSNARLLDDIQAATALHIGRQPLILSRRSFTLALLQSECTIPTLRLKDVPVNICLAAACEHQRKVISERCYRCFHRLRHVISNGGIIPGGGVAEVLTAMEIASICINDTYLDSYDFPDGVNKLDVLSTLKAIEEALLTYPALVLLRNGCDWSTSVTSVSISQTIIKNYLGVTKSQDSILAQLLEIASSDRMTFFYDIPRPIALQDDISLASDISQTDGKVLDIMRLRIEAMKSSISFVIFAMKHRC